MSELEALRAYFAAHMEMSASDKVATFGAAYVKANNARDRLLQLAHEVAMQLQSGCKGESQ